MTHSITNKKSKKTIKVISIALWILLWQIMTLIINKEVYLPSPLETFRALINLFPSKYLWLSLMMSIYRVIVGFFLSVITGIILGLVCGLNEIVYEIFNPLIMVIRSTPVVSFIIIALLWFESGNVPIFICFLMCFPIIWINVIEGIKNTNKDILQMAQIYQISNIRIVKEIYLPSILPYVIAGATSALGMGWKVTVAAEVLSHPKMSIGTNLFDAKIYLETSTLFAWTFLIIVLSYLFEYILKKILSNKKLCWRQ